MWRRKMWRKWGNFQEYISRELLGWCSLNLVRRASHVYEGYKICTFDRNYILVVIDIRGVENGELAVPVNNTCTLVCHMLSWPLTHDHVSWFWIQFYRLAWSWTLISDYTHYRYIDPVWEIFLASKVYMYCDKHVDLIIEHVLWKWLNIFPIMPHYTNA